MHISDPTLATEELDELVKEAHEKICPYSHATRGNVQVDFEVKGRAA
jgi:organic hydroperoxide reductase OsmC/OhrA